jgi:hypothetical protein
MFVFPKSLKKAAFYSALLYFSTPSTENNNPLGIALTDARPIQPSRYTMHTSDTAEPTTLPHSQQQQQQQQPHSNNQFNINNPPQKSHIFPQNPQNSQNNQQNYHNYQNYQNNNHNRLTPDQQRYFFQHFASLTNLTPLITT